MNKFFSQILKGFIPSNALAVILVANGTSLDELVQNAKIQMNQNVKEVEQIQLKASKIKDAAEDDFQQTVQLANAKLQEQLTAVHALNQDAGEMALQAHQIQKALEFVEN